MKKYFEKLNHVKIRIKIIIAYSIVLLLSFALSFVSFKLISEYSLEREMGEGSLQTLTALDRNLELILSHVKEMSKLIFFDSKTQNILTSIESEQINPKIQSNITKSLTNMILSGEYISSVFIFDKYNNNYSAYKNGDYIVKIKDLKKAPWYERIEKLNGDIAFIPDSGGVIGKRNDSTKCISLIRNIVNINNYKKIATLIINIDESVIKSYFEEVSKDQQAQIFIVDSKNNYIISPTENKEIIKDEILSKSDALKDYQSMYLNGQKVMVSQKASQFEDWRIINIMPIKDRVSNIREDSILYIIIIVINFIFVFICTILLTRWIFKPLDTLQAYMQQVEQGKFIRIPVQVEQSNEIISLKHGFNKMVLAIQKLIEKIKEEEKATIKNELALIQAQINPHFLYNTLDAASALNLIGDNENAYKVVQALGDFYRNSLSSGKEVITVSEELEGIMSYITILNIRYENKIKLVCDIEDEILEYSILKLILQPLVENAVYHGIRYKRGKGNITITGYRDDTEIIFIVTDDGQGMTEEKCKSLLAYKKTERQSGFGLYSCMQRISIFYNIEQPMTITSQPEIGTEITIRLKVLEEVKCL